ncbi:MAG: hypothetical protein VW492_02065 [Deltaproteobacteria bacterium]
MLRKILLSSILLVLLPFTIWCSERAGRPVQLQLVNFSGVALGYHISDSIYLGYTYVSSMDLSLEPQNPRALYGQDYVEKVDVEEDRDQTIELRISPFDSGLYFSIGGLSTGRKYQKVTFEERNRVLPNDTQLPSTKIFVVTEVEPWSGLGLGLGYTAIWDFGLSIGLGLIFSPVQLEPEVSVTADPDISAADKQSLIERVEKDFGKPNPSLGYLAIGYNF